MNYLLQEVLGLRTYRSDAQYTSGQQQALSMHHTIH